MRLFLLNFLLLASAAIVSSEERHKRHFPLLIKLIKSAIFGPEEGTIQEVAVPLSKPEYEVFRLPGHDGVVVKVSPKMSADGVMYPEVEPVNLKAFGSVVGIESPDDTLSAVREVDKLLSSGILYGGYDDLMNDHIVAMFPGVRTVEEEIVPVIESRLTEVIQPLEERVEFEVPLDLYEQNNVREQATIITADTKPGTELVESIQKNELPNCIRRRIAEAVLLGADPYRYERVEKVYPVPVVELIYPRLGDRLIQNQIHKKILKGFETIADFGLPAPLLLSQKREDSSKPVHLEDVQVIVSKHDGKSENEKSTAFTNTGEEVDLSQTLGPIPSWYLERMKITENLKTIDHSKPVVIEPFIENSVSQPEKTEEVLADTVKSLKIMELKPHPLYVHASKPVHLEDVQVSFPKHDDKSENVKITAFTSNGKKVDLSKTLAPIQSQYFERMKVTANSKNNDQPKPIVIAPSKDIKKVVAASTNLKTNVKKVSAEVKPDQIAPSKENLLHSTYPHIEIAEVSAKPTTVHKKEDEQVKSVQISTTTSPSKAEKSDGKDSGYVYVNHPNPFTVKVVKKTESDAPKTNVKTNNDNNLKVVTPVKIEPAKATVQLKDSEKVAEPKIIVVPLATSMNPLKTNQLKEKSSLDLNPVAILNSSRSKDHQKHYKLAEPHVKTYSYQQKQADGSSINVEADHNVISVDFKGRGDIPEK